MRIKSDVRHPEFSRPLAIEKISPSGMEHNLEAKESERKALAERFGLLDLPKLEARLKVHPARADQTIVVSGTLTADVVQQCVVTLDPVPGRLELEVKTMYAPDGMMEGGAGPSDLSEEEMEPIIDGVIDLGELVAQNLAVGLDPYPRKPGVDYVETAFGEDKAQSGPLAHLVNWPKKPKDSA